MQYLAQKYPNKSTKIGIFSWETEFWKKCCPINTLEQFYSRSLFKNEFTCTKSGSDRKLQNFPFFENSALKCILRLSPLTITKLIHKEAKLQTLNMRYQILLSKYAFDQTKIESNIAPITRATCSNAAPLMIIVDKW